MFCKKLVFIHFQTLSGPFGLKTKDKNALFHWFPNLIRPIWIFKHSVKKWFPDPSRSLSISRFRISSFKFECRNFKSQYSNFRLQNWKMGWAAWAVGAEILGLILGLTLRIVVRKITKKKSFGKNQTERSGFSESPGRETLNPNFWTQSQLFFGGKIEKNYIF